MSIGQHHRERSDLKNAVSLPLNLSFVDDAAFQELSPTLLKSCYAALVSFILESAKHNTDPLASTYVVEFSLKRLTPPSTRLLAFSNPSRPSFQ